MSGPSSRRMFLRGAAVVTGSALLAACGATPTPVPPTATPKPSAPSASAPTATVAAAVPATKIGGTIRVAHWWGKAFSEKSTALKIFMDKTGVTVNEEPNSPGGEGVMKLITQIAAGTGPDVSMIDATGNGYFYPKDIIMPIEDAMAKYNLDDKKWAIDQKMENGYKGHTMGLSLFPMQTSTLFLNKKMAEETGMKLPYWGDPKGPANADFDSWRWADLLEFLKRGTKVKADGTVEQYGIDSAGNGIAGLIAGCPDRIYELGGTQFDEGTWTYEEKECKINSPQAVRAIQDILDLDVKYHYGPTDTYAQGIEGGLFRAGKSMASWCWSGAHIYPPENLSFEPTYIMMPWDNNPIQEVGANYFSVFKASKSKDAAAAFAIMMATDWDICEQSKQFALPSYDSVAHAMLETKPKYLEGYMLWLCRTKLGKCPACATNVKYMPRWAGGLARAAFDASFNVNYGKAKLGELTVQQAMDNVKKETDAAIKAGG